MNWPRGLNPDQQHAIECGTANVATVAGPGTGKTRTLLHKALQLLEEEIARPDDMRIVNFTNAGVFDLRRKMVADAEYASLDPRMATTFHSLALRILLSANAPTVPSPLVVLDDWEERTFVDQLAKMQLNLDNVRRARRMREDYNSRWCIASESVDEWLGDGSRRQYEAVYNLAKDLLAFTTRGELTFLWWRFLRSQPGSSHRDLEFQWSHLLVDEYQDLNECEQDILELLARSGVSVFAVGDPNQSIYETMRHAHPDLCWSFAERVSPGELFVLDQSYRCPSAVLRFGRALFEDPQGVPDPDRAATVGEAEILNFPTDDAERSALARLAAGILSRYPESRVLVAVPTRTMAKPIADELAEVVTVEDRTRKPVEGPDECRLANAILKLMREPRNSVAAATAIVLFCAPSTRDTRVRELLQAGRAAGLKIADFLTGQGVLPRQLDRGRQRTLQAIEAVTHSGEPLRSLGEITGCTGLGSDSDMENAEERIERVLAGTEQLSPGRATVMTLHACKGTEAEWVILPSVEPGLYERDSVGAAKEERRRLLYVGMTRAMEGLFISFAARRWGSDRYRDPVSQSSRKGPSVFLDEICDRAGYTVRAGGEFLREKLAALATEPRD